LSQDEARLRTTGTDNEATILDSSCSSVAQTCATERDSLITLEHPSMNEGETGRKTKPLVLQGVEDDCERLIPSDSSSPRVTRLEMSLERVAPQAPVDRPARRQQ
jgi:hypothetical protein